MKKLTLIGLGLMGASIALNAKHAKLAETVVGHDINLNALQTAKEKNYIDIAESDLEKAVNHADIIIISVPVKQISAVFKTLDAYVGSSTVITDVGSTKLSTLAAIKKYFARQANQFVPSHPIAGSERQGGHQPIQELFKGKKVILTPLDNTDKDALRKIENFWHQLGATTECMSAKEHDALLALTSHLPHLLAMALTNSNTEKTLAYTGEGYKSFSRIAKANPNIWTDIFLDNHHLISEALEKFEQELNKFKTAMANNNQEAIKQLIMQSKKLREKLD